MKKLVIFLLAPPQGKDDKGGDDKHPHVSSQIPGPSDATKQVIVNKVGDGYIDIKQIVAPLLQQIV